MKNNLRRIIIAAIAQNGVIGFNNNIPWNSKEELQHFKDTTIGFPIIFGRLTFQSIKKPLKGRLNLIISEKSLRNKGSNNQLYFRSVKSSYNFLRNNNYEKVFIGGGERIYRNTIKHSEEMIISHMKFVAEGDKKFPRINMKLWKVKSMKEYNEFSVKHYVRKNLSN